MLCGRRRRGPWFTVDVIIEVGANHVNLPFPARTLIEQRGSAGAAETSYRIGIRFVVLKRGFALPDPYLVGIETHPRHERRTVSTAAVVAMAVGAKPRRQRRLELDGTAIARPHGSLSHGVVLPYFAVFF